MMRLFDWLRPHITVLTRPRPRSGKPPELIQAEYELRRVQLLERWRRQDEAEAKAAITEARSKTRYEAWEQDREDTQRLATIENQIFEDWQKWYTSPAGMRKHSDYAGLAQIIHERRDQLELDLNEAEETQGVVDGAVEYFNRITKGDLLRAKARQSERGKVLGSWHLSKQRRQHHEYPGQAAGRLWTNLDPYNAAGFYEEWRLLTENEQELARLYEGLTPTQMAQAEVAYDENLARELIFARLDRIDPETEELTVTGGQIINGTLALNPYDPEFGTFGSEFPSSALRTAAVLDAYARIQKERDAENEADARAHETNRGMWRRIRGRSRSGTRR